jgi:tetratricopeptide (TPR) repeat protein
MKLVAAAASAALLLGLAGCPSQSRNDSVKASNEGTKAYGQKQFDTAIERYQKAIERWRDNHTAWYGLAGSHIGKKDWKGASDAAGNAVQIAPEVAMYQMVYGYTLYEKAVQNAKEAQAPSQGKKPDEITPDLSSVNFEKPLQHLQEALKLNNELWRAHYYLGRIYRDTGKVKEAAEEFTKALQGVPPEAAPWIALADLYRAWDYTDQALGVATQGTAGNILPDPNEAGEVWYVVGMSYDDKSLHEKAIEAYSKALELRRDLHKAKFQRGQAYFKKGDYTAAKRDLEEFSKTGGASVDFSKQQAAKMLMDIAAKSATTPGAPAEKLSPEEAVKKGKAKKG